MSNQTNETSGAATRETRGTPPPNSLFFGKPFWQLQAELREKFNAEIVYPPQPEGWISVKERKPDRAGYYLVIVENDDESEDMPVGPSVNVGRWCRDMGGSYLEWAYFGSAVTHWTDGSIPLAAEPAAPGASALAESCEIISNLVEKLDFEGITESESDSIVRAKEFVRAAAPAGTQPAQEEK